jgi:septal ring factor EnvC (AmiA/AmiB activator)
MTRLGLLTILMIASVACFQTNESADRSAAEGLSARPAKSTNARSFLAAILVFAVMTLATTGNPVPVNAQDIRAQNTSQLPAGAPPNIDRKQQTLQDLDAVARDIRLGEERQAQIARDIAALDKDRTRINEQLVAAATRERDLETSVSASESRIADIEAQADGVRQSLSEHRAVLAEVLAALQRIGRKPPPAVLVRPEDALASVRSAILIGAVLPELRGEADRVADDLGRLVTLKQQSSNERDQFRQAVTDLKDETARLEQLMDERRRTKGDQEKRLDDERHKQQELSDKAGSLRELIGKLDNTPMGLRGDINPLAKSDASNRTDPTKLARLDPNADQKSVTPDAGEPVRLQPAIRFADAKSKLPIPVAGAIVKNFGDDDGTGSALKGIRIATRPDARVASPCDGSVMYAGPFRSYGKLLIIDGGDGYHVVLAGMERINVERGQFVLAGEPVGLMGARRSASASNDVNSALPVLYVEFRKDNASIDPAPWWVQTRDEKVRG